MKVSIATGQINISSGDILFWGRYYLIADAVSESKKVDAFKLIELRNPCISLDFSKNYTGLELVKAVKDGLAIHYPKSEYYCKLHKKTED